MKHYLDIERIKPKYENAFEIGEDIIIEEKVDGSNSSIVYDSKTDSVLAFSRRQQLTETKTLNGFWEWVQRLPKTAIKIATNYGRYIIFGEWLVHNKISYPDNKYNNFYMFDVYDTTDECYLSYEQALAIYNGLEKALMKADERIYFVPVFYEGPFKGWDKTYEYIGRSDLGAAPCGEGIVVKSQERLTDKNNRIPFYIKIVSDHFSEVQKVKKVPTPEELEKKNALRNYAATVVTIRRCEKMLRRLVEDGIIPADWDEHNMGVIAKNIGRLMYEDCLKEEEDTVKAIENFGKICNSLTMEYVRTILNERNKVKD